jgi:hypothetical protein
MATIQKLNCFFKFLNQNSNALRYLQYQMPNHKSVFYINKLSKLSKVPGSDVHELIKNATPDVHKPSEYHKFA